MRVYALYGEANALNWKSFERQNSKHSTLLKHQDTKTALYKLPKSHWVITLFEIFGSIRNKLLVTVFSDHPVVMGCGKARFGRRGLKTSPHIKK